jgi:hypothetical protein
VFTQHATLIPAPAPRTYARGAGGFSKAAARSQSHKFTAARLDRADDAIGWIGGATAGRRGPRLVSGRPGRVVCLPGRPACAWSQMPLHVREPRRKSPAGAGASSAGDCGIRRRAGQRKRPLRHGPDLGPWSGPGFSAFSAFLSQIRRISTNVVKPCPACAKSWADRTGPRIDQMPKSLCDNFSLPWLKLSRCNVSSRGRSSGGARENSRTWPECRRTRWRTSSAGPC